MDSRIQMIDVRGIKPHPQNPRKDLGDLTELAMSIEAKGILQNLTIVKHPIEDFATAHYRCVIGHRRLAAAKEAGLAEVPCVVAEMDEKEQIETMLLENIQRADLTVLEQAEGFQLMMDLGETAASVAEKTGFSEQTVKHRLEIAKLKEMSVTAAMKSGLTLMDFAKLEKIKSVKSREKVLKDATPGRIDDLIERALRDERVAERKPTAKKTVNSFATYDESFPEYRYSAKKGWEWYKEYDLGDEVEPKILTPKDADKVKYRWRWDWHEHEIILFREQEKKGKTEAELAEEAAKKAFKAKVEKIKAVAEDAHARRLLFAMKIFQDKTSLKKHTDELITYAAKQLCVYNYQDDDLLREVTLIEAKEGLSYSASEAMDDILAKGKTPLQALFAELYVIFDSVPLRFHQASEYYKTLEPVKDSEYTNARSDAMRVYDLLSLFGYEMGDEERTYVEGTHELYDKREDEKAS
jgi:ParB family chromosome partitioning protein